MSLECEICGKKPLVGNKISHAHNKTRKRSFPNLQTVKVVVDNVHKKMRVCTRCIRSNRITKAI